MIGVCDGTKIVGGFDSLKRDLLFFDKLHLMGAEPGLHVLRATRVDKEKYGQLADELEYLLGTPFFDTANTGDLLQQIETPSNDKEREINSAIAWIYERDIRAKELERMFNNRPNPILLRDILKIKESQVSIMSRLEARRLSIRGEPATSNEPMPLEKPHVSEAPTVGDVIQLSINLVPTPDPNTPWEEIFLLKEDQEIIDRSRKLRLWSTEQARSGKDLAFLAEKIRDSVADYERVIKAHRLKLKTGVLRSVVVGAAGVLEDICKLRFEKAAERIFSATAAKADMLLAEASAPGLELSLITLLKDKLSGE